LAVLPSTDNRTGFCSDIDLTLDNKYSQSAGKNLIAAAERNVLKPNWLLDGDERRQNSGRRLARRG
jgi:hypothetical protein